MTYYFMPSIIGTMECKGIVENKSPHQIFQLSVYSLLNLVSSSSPCLALLDEHSSLVPAINTDTHRLQRKARSNQLVTPAASQSRGKTASLCVILGTLLLQY